MKKIGYILLTITIVSVAAVMFVNNVQAARVQFFTITNFVNELVDKGIISPEKENVAQEIVSMIANIEGEDITTPRMNAEFVEVSVSQMITNSSRTYNVYEDIEGLVLLVKNTTNNAITLEATRKCQVVYRILDGDGNEVYNSRDTEQCQTDEMVTYRLDAEQTRMFTVEHKTSAFELEKGMYTFEIEYPGYGGGEKEITIL